MVANQTDSIQSSEGRTSTEDTFRKFHDHFEKHLKARYTPLEVKYLEDLIKNRDVQLIKMAKDFNSSEDSKLLQDCLEKLIEPLKQIDATAEPLFQSQTNEPLDSPAPRQGFEDDGTPGFDKNKAQRIEILKSTGPEKPKTEQGAFSQYSNHLGIQSAPLPKQSPASPSLVSINISKSSAREKGGKKSFKQLLVNFVLQNEGFSPSIIQSFIDFMETRDNEMLSRDLVDHAKSRLVQILSEEFSAKDANVVLANGDMFLETFENTNRVKGDPYSFLKTELNHKLNGLSEEQRDRIYANVADDLEGMDKESPRGSLNKSSNSSRDKRSRVSLKSKKGSQYQTLKLQTTFGDALSPKELQAIKSLSPESDHQHKGRKLVKKDTLLVENNHLVDDDLENIGCFQTKHIKKLTQILEKIIGSALYLKDITETDISNLKRLLNFVPSDSPEPPAAPHPRLPLPERPGLPGHPQGPHVAEAHPALSRRTRSTPKTSPRRCSRPPSTACARC